MAIKTSAVARQWGSACVKPKSTSVLDEVLFARAKARR